MCLLKQLRVARWSRCQATGVGQNPDLDILCVDRIKQLGESVMGKGKIVGSVIGVVLLVGVLAWMFTAPYLSNQGLGRTPGVLIGGTVTPPMADFSPLNDSVRGPLKFKLDGFEMTATEIHGDDRIAMMRQWAAKSGGRTLDEPAYPGSEPLRDWKVFFWTPRT